MNVIEAGTCTPDVTQSLRRQMQLTAAVAKAEQRQLASESARQLAAAAAANQANEWQERLWAAEEQVYTPLSVRNNRLLGVNSTSLYQNP